MFIWFYKTGYGKTDRIKMEQIEDQHYKVNLPAKVKKEAFEFWFDAGESSNGVNFPSTGRKYYTLPGNENVYSSVPAKIDLNKFANEKVAKFTGVNPRIYVKFKPGGKSTVVVIKDIAGNIVTSIPVKDLQYDNRIIWDGINASGKRAPVGIYTSTVMIDGRPGGKQIFLGSNSGRK
ncbi:MAG: hypothetical protein IPJ75_05770 [Ignavibacteriales bacterium]|nr:hypothetical protein [Ignavibacteriales bacterium]